MKFIIAVDGLERYNINFKNRDLDMEAELIDAINDFKRTGENIVIDVNGLGILQVDDVRLAFKRRSVLINSTLIVDYTEGTV